MHLSLLNDVIDPLLATIFIVHLIFGIIFRDDVLLKALINDTFGIIVGCPGGILIQVGLTDSPLGSLGFFFPRLETL